MGKIRQGLASDDPNDVQAIKQLKALVNKAKEERQREKLLQLKGKRRQRQASITAVFSVAKTNTDLQQRLEMIAQELH